MIIGWSGSERINVLRCFLVAVLLFGPSFLTARPLEVPAPFQQGMREIRNGQFRRAIETSKTLRNAFPQNPLSQLIAAEAYWGMIYCQTGHINSREIWNVADTKASSYDKEFFEAVDA